jgi:hypothetical protein
MNVEARLARIEERQAALVSAIIGLTDITAQTRDLVTELMAWLQEPPSSELPDLLKAVTAAVGDQGERITAMHALLVKLPAQVAQTVTASEVA